MEPDARLPCPDPDLIKRFPRGFPGFVTCPATPCKETEQPPLSGVPIQTKQFSCPVVRCFVQQFVLVCFVDFRNHCVDRLAINESLVQSPCNFGSAGTASVLKRFAERTRECQIVKVAPIDALKHRLFNNGLLVPLFP